MTFTTTKLLNGGYLVEGTDSRGVDGSTILISDRWDAVLHLKAHDVADAQFGALVEEFFRPITEAAEQAAALLNPVGKDWNTVVMTEGQDGIDTEVIDLDPDGVILRILSEGQHDLLRWVGGDTLVAISA